MKPLPPTDIPYTIAFLIQGNQVLMIHRKRQPWIGKWNGLGGKKEGNESAYDCTIREINEETDIDLKNIDASIIDKGIISWNTSDGKRAGMNAFVITIPKEHKLRQHERTIDEGVIAWKSLQWVCNPKNPDVATNIPYFLPEMMKTNSRKNYHCLFNEDRVIIKSYPL